MTDNQRPKLVELTPDALTHLQLHIPDYMHEGIIAYIEEGRPAGDFLRSFISSDIKGIAAHADSVNIHRLRDYLYWFWNFAPSNVWGSSEAYEEHISKGNKMFAEWLKAQGKQDA